MPFGVPEKYRFNQRNLRLTEVILLRHFCSLKQEKENERRQVEQMSARFTEPTDPISGMTAEESLALEHAEEEAVRHDVEKRHKRVVKSRETERCGGVQVSLERSVILESHIIFL